MRRVGRDERGAVAAEYVAALVLVAAVVAAIWALALPQRVEEVGQEAVDCLFRGDRDGCDLAGAGPEGDGPGDGVGDLDDLQDAVDQLPPGSQIVDDRTGEVLWTVGDELPDGSDEEAALLLDLLRTLADIDEHLATVVGRDSLDDDGLPLVVNLNVATGSAYWDPREGEPHYLQTAYAEGWALPHIVAHEFGHGLVHFVIDFHEKGSTTDEQASMNEGLADIISFNVTGVVDREDPDTGDVYRSMGDPEGHGQPAHVDDYDLNVGCQVPPCIHNNSSIVSHAYYLMSEGSEGVDEHRDEPLGIDGVGVEIAQEIFYTALPNLDTHSDLVSYRDVMLDAAAELHGTDSDTYRQVEAALAAVGLDDDFEGV